MVEKLTAAEQRQGSILVPPAPCGIHANSHSVLPAVQPRAEVRCKEDMGARLTLNPSTPPDQELLEGDSS